MSPTPGVEWRTLAMVASTLWPGSWPPSPGLAPWAILICIMSELTRYSVVTPKRPEATCLMAERMESPLGSGVKRSTSSPPSPVLERPPIRFMAMARVVCASRLMEPKDMAPVAKRLTISSAGSTSSRGTGEGQPVALDGLARDLVETNALDLGVRAGEILGDEAGPQSHGIEDLRAAIRLVGGDAHLGHDLEDALVGRLHVALDGFLGRQLLVEIRHHGFDALEREIGVDGLRTVTRERAELIDLASFTGLDHEADRGP